MKYSIGLYVKVDNGCNRLLLLLLCGSYGREVLSNDFLYSLYSINYHGMPVIRHFLIKVYVDQIVHREKRMHAFPKNIITVVDSARIQSHFFSFTIVHPIQDSRTTQSRALLDVILVRM